MLSGLEFGLLLHTRHLIRGDRGASGRTELDAFWATAERAETDGYDHLWTGDSPRISQLDRAHADCLTIMAGLAARTGKIRIGAVPLIAALRNPVLLAHSLATLDVISDGRLLVGVSAAPQYKYAEREFAACGVPFAERAGRLEESIGVMRRLWTEESFSFQGKYYSWPEMKTPSGARRSSATAGLPWRRHWRPISRGGKRSIASRAPPAATSEISPRRCSRRFI